MTRQKRKYLPDYDAILASGQTIGKYHIEAELAQTGLGSVYHVTEHHKHYVLKLLAKDFAEVDGLAAYLKVVGKRDYVPLQHENLLRLQRVGMLEGRIFLLRDYAPRGTLQDMLLQQGMLSVEAVRGLLQPLGSALSFIHQKGIIHQNLKPSNVLLGNDNQVYVADLGMAPLLEAAAQTFLVEGVRLSTPNFLAPEQLKNKDVSFQTDVYALGALLFALLTGYPPYDASDPEELFQMQYSQAVPSAREFNPSIPAEIDQALRVALSFARVSRFETIGELLAACGVGLPMALPVLAPEPEPEEPVVSELPELAAEDVPPVSDAELYQSLPDISPIEDIAPKSITTTAADADAAVMFEQPPAAALATLGEEAPAAVPEIVQPMGISSLRKGMVMLLSSLAILLAIGVSSSWAYGKWIGNVAPTQLAVAATEVRANGQPIALLTAGITLPPVPTDAAGVAIGSIDVTVAAATGQDTATAEPTLESSALVTLTTTQLQATAVLEIDTGSEIADTPEIATDVVEPSQTATITPTSQGDAVLATNVALGLVSAQPTATNVVLLFDFGSAPTFTPDDLAQGGQSGTGSGRATATPVGANQSTNLNTNATNTKVFVTATESAAGSSTPNSGRVLQPTNTADSARSTRSNLVVVPTTGPVVVSQSNDFTTATPVVVAQTNDSPPAGPVVIVQPTDPPPAAPVVIVQPTDPPQAGPVVIVQPTNPPPAAPVVITQPTDPPPAAPVVIAQPTNPPPAAPVVIAQPTNPPPAAPVVIAQPTSPPPTSVPVVIAQPTSPPPTSAPVVIAQPTSPPPTSVPVQPVNSLSEQPPRDPFSQVQTQVINLTNQQRSCSALSHFAGLADAALSRSNDMAARNYFSHMDPANGALIFPTLLSSAYNGMGENLFIAPLIIPEASVAEVAVNAWMGSSGHRANLLNCSYRYIGVGVAMDANCATYNDGCWLITQLFSTDHP
jgi:serine/threonine protein kinase/uncharacterized protein YkwD